MTWTDELVEQAVRAVGEEGTVEEAIDWLTKVIPCPTPVCREEPLDEDRFLEIQERMREMMSDNVEALEGLSYTAADEVAVLAALTIEPWNIEEAAEWVKTFLEAKPDNGRERQVTSELQRMAEEGRLEEDELALWTEELIETAVRAVSNKAPWSVDDAIAWMGRAKSLTPKKKKVPTAWPLV
eukprot:TRINITY_DN76_c0_g1_i3.p1 TRINITY_DN76_c0_g1~~TRINITY_DN76_c0_g1_i3.p1  ORF type:complete len:183 (+),score=37.48 TRINITY_DN76_c0_g1_i3:141-689(+)